MRCVASGERLFANPRGFDFFVCRFHGIHVAVGLQEELLGAEDPLVVGVVKVDSVEMEMHGPVRNRDDSVRCLDALAISDGAAAEALLRLVRGTEDDAGRNNRVCRHIPRRKLILRPHEPLARCITVEVVGAYHNIFHERTPCSLVGNSTRDSLFINTKSIFVKHLQTYTYYAFRVVSVGRSTINRFFHALRKSALAIFFSPVFAAGSL